MHISAKAFILQHVRKAYGMVRKTARDWYKMARLLLTAFYVLALGTTGCQERQPEQKAGKMAEAGAVVLDAWGHAGRQSEREAIQKQVRVFDCLFYPSENMQVFRFWVSGVRCQDIDFNLDKALGSCKGNTVSHYLTNTL